MTQDDVTAAGVGGEAASTLQALIEGLPAESVQPLQDAIVSLSTYVGLIHAAAAGAPASVDALRAAILAMPIPRGSLANVDSRPGRVRASHAGRDLLSPHPWTFFSASKRIVRDALPRHRLPGMTPLERGDATGGEGFRDVQAWMELALGGWAVRAGPIQTVLDEGRLWRPGEEPTKLLGLLEALRDPMSLLPERAVLIPNLDERQVCLGELIFTVSRLGAQLNAPSFPPLGSVAPESQCLSTATEVSMVAPDGQPYPDQSAVGAVFPVIDRRAATVLSWAPDEIRLQLPPGIAAGCHTVGWYHLYDAGIVSQLQGIGEQCGGLFNANVAAPTYAVWVDQGEFSLISSPTIQFFSGPGGSSAPSAEACTPVTLHWKAAVEACANSSVRLVVLMLRDGSLYRTALPPEGQLVLSDSETHTYTLRVLARLEDQTCGEATSSLTVHRHNELRVTALGDRNCVATGTGVSFHVATSCPAGPGGREVSVVSSDPGRVGGTSVSIPEGLTSVDLEILAGTECGEAVLTFSVPDHPIKKLAVTVTDDPQITDVTPMLFQTCQPVTLTIRGTCLGYRRDYIAVSIKTAAGGVAGAVKVVSPGTELHVSFPPLPVGTYPLTLTNCNHVAVAPKTIDVMPRPPSIVTPLKANVNSVALCSSPQISLSWEAQDITRAILTRDNGMVVVDRQYSDSCSPISDNAVDSIGSVSNEINYTLTVFAADGSPLTNSLLIPWASAYPPCSAVVLHNPTGRILHVFLVNVESQHGGQFIGGINPQQTRIIPLPECLVRCILTLDPEKVLEYNDRWNTNLDSTDVAVARTGGAWNRFQSQWMLGLANAPSAGAYEA